MEHAGLNKCDMILKILEQEYPSAQTALRYENPFQLLVAVILSAQTTDKQVNKITETLFRKVKKPEDVLSMELVELEGLLKGCGLYRQKSRQIYEASRILVEKHGGKLPQTREALMELPGVGRKTANVLLSTAFRVPALAVDTHVMRVSKRLGFSGGKTPREVEGELLRLLPEDSWNDFHHRLIFHGRKVCRARNPLCGSCPLSPYCLFYRKNTMKNFNGEKDYSG